MNISKENVAGYSSGSNPVKMSLYIHRGVGSRDEIPDIVKQLWPCRMR